MGKAKKKNSRSENEGWLNLGQKAELIEYHQKNPELSKRELAAWAYKTYQLSKPPHRTTIGTILRDSARYTSVQPHDTSLLRTRKPKHETLEIALSNWILQMQHRKICLSDDMIQEKARQLAELIDDPSFINFQFSQGWLANFKNRYQFRRWRRHGESGDAQIEGTEEEVKRIREKIKSYGPELVYNMDETGLFYNMAPDTTIARRQIEGDSEVNH
jgi:hypothetical protein